MPTINDSVQVNVPVHVAYNQWTQFEDFPRFMTGVEEVKQVDEKRLHWRAEFWGKDLEWDSEITKQVPDQLIAWRSTGGLTHAGFVQFRPVSQDQTEVAVRIDYKPEGIAQNVGSAVGAASSRLHSGLQHFKEFLENRGKETGAWRGSING
jgi:uncharacterized membrane protein